MEIFSKKLQKRRYKQKNFSANIFFELEVMSVIRMRSILLESILGQTDSQNTEKCVKSGKLSKVAALTS